MKEIKNLQEKRLIIARHIMLDQIEPTNENIINAWCNPFSADRCKLDNAEDTELFDWMRKFVRSNDVKSCNEQLACLRRKGERNLKSKEYLSIADKRVLDIRKSEIQLLSNDEVFVLVNGTNNYWISNHGRLVNNLHGNFYMHKSGYAHYTLSGIKGKIETYTDKLVAEHFLEKPDKCNKIWHIDKDKNNCFYRNLVWVSNEEYIDLEREILYVEELGRQQEYVPYITLKFNTAYSIWNGIYKRCYKDKDVYEGAFMCDLWKYDKDSFAEWWNAEYYECDGESMAVDKDLLFPGNKEYAPDKCCILPQTLNTMLSNCKKHKLPKWKTAKMDLPLGVRYNSSMKMYYGEIKPYGHDEVIRLSYWETPEEAFAEYKRHKQADILIMADKYKNKVPKKVYDALLRFEVRPYIED